MHIICSKITTMGLCTLVIGTSAAIILREGELAAKALTVGMLVILAAALILGRKNRHGPEDSPERKKEHGQERWRVFDNALLLFLLIMNLTWVLGR